MTTYQWFRLAQGSTMGRDHRLVPKNCQDATYVNAEQENFRFGVIADGCGSSARSEVGAQLGVRLVSEALRAELAGATRCQAPDINWRRVQQHVLASLDVLARQMGGDYRKTVEEYFLFTIVGVVLAGQLATFFALGDGVVIVNGFQYQLGPFAGNMPPYAGYGLISDKLTIDPDSVVLRPVLQVPLTELDSFLIGSDGVMDIINAAEKMVPGLGNPVGSIAQFWEDDRYFQGNPELVSRRLKLLARDWPKHDPEPGLLPDDTSLIVGQNLHFDPGEESW
jgi:serine/threonine protein phosphatase PrpC